MKESLTTRSSVSPLKPISPEIRERLLTGVATLERRHQSFVLRLKQRVNRICNLATHSLSGLSKPVVESIVGRVRNMEKAAAIAPKISPDASPLDRVGAMYESLQADAQRERMTQQIEGALRRKTWESALTRSLAPRNEVQQQQQRPHQTIDLTGFREQLRTQEEISRKQTQTLKLRS